MNPLLLIISVTMLLTSCGKIGRFQTPASGTVHSVVVSWTANREVAVNQSGGGYKVAFSQDPNFSFDSAAKVDVPYVSGATAPTTTTLNLRDGTYYIKVEAYSAMTPPGSSSGAFSSPSAPAEITVP